MNRKPAAFDMPPDALAAMDMAITGAELACAPLLALLPEQRRQLARIGDRSESFCRQCAVAFAQSPRLLPRHFDLDGYLHDLAMLDALRPRLARLAHLHQRALDTEMALGSDQVANAIEGYALLRAAGRADVLEPLRKAISARSG